VHSEDGDLFEFVIFERVQSLFKFFGEEDFEFGGMIEVGEAIETELVWGVSCVLVGFVEDFFGAMFHGDFASELVDDTTFGEHNQDVPEVGSINELLEVGRSAEELSEGDAGDIFGVEGPNPFLSENFVGVGFNAIDESIPYVFLGVWLRVFESLDPSGDRAWIFVFGGHGKVIRV
jgi:hypothetical protein